MQDHFSTPAKHRRLSIAMNKMRELLTPSAPMITRHASTDTCHSVSTKLTEIPSHAPFLTLRLNSQTMKNYACQRSDKIPLRVPPSFPTSLNFSQQTIYLFDSSDDEDDNDSNFYLDDMLHGPAETIAHGQTPETKVKRRSLQSPGSHNDNKKNKKFGFNVFPLNKSISFQLPRKVVKKSETSIFRSINSSSLAIKPANEFAETKVLNKLDDCFARIIAHASASEYSNLHESSALEFSKLPERKRFTSLPTKLDSTYFNRFTGLNPQDTHPSSLENIAEQSQPPTLTLSSDHETMALTSECSQREVECPRINMILTSSPLFHDGHPTLSRIARPSPSTPRNAISLSQNVHGYPSQVLTPNSPPETPTTCVNSCCSHHATTPHSKFLMSTGSPGIFNLPHAHETPTKRQLSLLSPYHIPSPLATRDSVSHSKNPRGPGPDMLATLEFLSDLCQKSPEYMQEHDSLFDHTSSEDSPES